MPQIEQVFLLADGTKFTWNGETYELISCNEFYQAKVKNKRGEIENFNGCAHVVLVEE